MSQQHPDDAIEEFRRAIELDFKDVKSHFLLGNALSDRQQLDEAIKEYRRAIELDPKNASLHYNLGNALGAKKQWNEAIEEYLKRAIDLNPQFAEAYCNLGQVLRENGKFVESLEAYRKGHRIGSARPDWPFPSPRWVRDAEVLVELDRKLSAIRERKEKPANDAERLALARLGKVKRLYATSAGFYAEAFANDVKLADDMPQHHRYNAACYALAGCGKGNDADKLDEQERARLRQQAVARLRPTLRTGPSKRRVTSPRSATSAADVETLAGRQ